MVSQEKLCRTVTQANFWTKLATFLVQESGKGQLEVMTIALTLSGTSRFRHGMKMEASLKQNSSQNEQSVLNNKYNKG